MEYHPTLVCADKPETMTHLVLDLDPPGADAFHLAVRVARLVRQTLADVGLEGAIKTSGAKGLHVFVPIVEGPQGMPRPPPGPLRPGCRLWIPRSPPPRL